MPQQSPPFQPPAGGEAVAHQAGYAQHQVSNPFAPQPQAQAPQAPQPFPMMQAPVQPGDPFAQQQYVQQGQPLYPLQPQPAAMQMQQMAPVDEAAVHAPSMPLSFRTRIRWENIVPFVAIIVVAALAVMYGGSLLDGSGSKVAKKSGAGKSDNTKGDAAADNNAVSGSFDEMSSDTTPAVDAQMSAGEIAQLEETARKQVAQRKFNDALVTLAKLSSAGPLNTDMATLHSIAVKEVAIQGIIDKATALGRAGKYQEAMSVLQKGYDRYRVQKLLDGINTLKQLMRGGGRPSPTKPSNIGNGSGPAVTIPPGGGSAPPGGPPGGQPPATSSGGTPTSPPTTPPGSGGDVAGHTHP